MGKTALITGASRGIGRGIALVLAEQGYDIAITYNSKEEEAALVCEQIEGMGVRAFYRQASLQEEGVAEETVAWAVKKLGRLDAMVCNAGVTIHNNLFTLTEEEIDFGYSLDFRSYMLCAKLAAENMRKNGAAGRIIFITSSRGSRVYPEDPIYGGMKAGLNRACQSLALEYSGDGITINCVAPGNTAIRGDFSMEELTAHRMQRKIPIGRSGTPKEVGEMVAYLCGPYGGYITGANIRQDGGLILPVMPLDAPPEMGRSWGKIPPHLAEKE